MDNIRALGTSRQTVPEPRAQAKNNGHRGQCSHHDSGATRCRAATPLTCELVRFTISAPVHRISTKPPRPPPSPPASRPVREARVRKSTARANWGAKYTDFSKRLNVHLLEERHHRMLMEVYERTRLPEMRRIRHAREQHQNTSLVKSMSLACFAGKQFLTNWKERPLDHRVFAFIQHSRSHIRKLSDRPQEKWPRCARNLGLA